MPIKEIPTLTRKTFIPRGTTALLDAIGLTLHEASTQAVPETKEAKVTVVIITDGHENSSETYNKDQVFDLIRKLEKDHNWQFVFLGANQDAIEEAQHLGIAKERALNFTSDKEGALNMFIDLSHNITLSVNECRPLAFTKEQREKQKRNPKQS